MRFVFLLIFIVFACKSEVKYPAAVGPIRNGIDLRSNGVVVEQAYLTYEDGSLVDEANTTTLNKKIKINIFQLASSKYLTKFVMRSSSLLSFRASLRKTTSHNTTPPRSEKTAGQRFRRFQKMHC